MKTIVSWFECAIDCNATVDKLISMIYTRIRRDERNHLKTLVLDFFALCSMMYNLR